MIKYCSIDTETGGFSPTKNPIVEIGLILADENYRIVEEYSTLVKNYNDLKYRPEAMEVHGITFEEINDSGVAVSQAYSELKELLSPEILYIGHNIKFDKSMLNALFHFCGDNLNNYMRNTFCTMEQAKKRLRLKSYSLTAVCERFKIPYEKKHRAKEDAKVTFEVFKKLRGK